MLRDLVVLTVVGSAAVARADAAIPEGVRDIEELSLDDLLAQETEVATTATPVPIRESPAVLTVVTREEILAAGARDLMDVMALVPGFVPFVDVQGTGSLTFRGLNAAEGRALVLWDGMTVNDFLYNSLELGNRFPVELIERVEVIRGPGSVVYGGFAELTVINIVTRGPKERLGPAATLTVGQHADTWGRQNLSLSYAAQLLPEASASVGVYLGQGHRSNKDFTDYYGLERSLADGSRLLPFLIDAGASYRDGKVRFIFENYRVDTRDDYDGSFEEPFRTRYMNLFASAEYDLRLGEGMVLTPKLSFLRQKPWETDAYTITDSADANPYYRKAAQRTTLNVTFTWDVLAQLNVLLGAEAYLEQGKVLGADALVGTGFQTLLEGKDEVTHANAAAFVQGETRNVAGTFTLGARFEEHSVYGFSFVPRAAFVRGFGPGHVKLLAARAFRAPALENLNLAFPGDPVEPEKTTVLELELGSQIGENAYVTGNLFDITIDDPIVYVYDATTGTEGYRNSGTTGSRGFEVDARVRFVPRFWVNASYSYYSAAGKNEVDLYTVPGCGNCLLGTPRHKVALLGSVEIIDRLRLNPQFIFLSRKAGYLTPYVDLVDYELVLGYTEPAYLASLFASYHDLGVKGLDVSAGVHNLFDDDNLLVQPYLGYHPPIASPGREFLVRLSYEP